MVVFNEAYFRIPIIGYFSFVLVDKLWEIEIKS